MMYIVESSESFYNSQYKLRFNKYNISDEVFYKLYKADPTSTEVSKGKYVVWVVDQYLKLIKDGKQNEAERFIGEDLYKITDNLTLFIDLQKKKLFANTVQVQQFATVNELYKFLVPYVHEKKPTKQIKNKDGIDLLFDKDGWTIESPKTFEAAKILTGSSNWCTANLSSYNHYIKQGPLLVIKHKKDKWQFHMQSGQWADVDNTMMNLHTWRVENDVPQFLIQFLTNFSSKKMKVLNVDLTKVKKIGNAEISNNNDGSIDVLVV